MKNADYYYNLAREYQTELKFDAALKKLQKALEEGFDPICIQKERGRIFLKQGDYTKAKESMFAAIAINPEDGETYAELGRIYEYNKEYIQAVKELNTAIHKGFLNEDVYKDLGRIYLDMDDHTLAISAYSKSIEINPDRAELSLGLGMAYEKAGKYDLALQCIETARDKGCSFAELSGSLERIYINQNKSGLAIETCMKSIELEPANDLLICELGNIYFMTNNYAAAIESYSKALSINPKAILPHIKLANIFINQGKPYDAEKELLLLLDNNPQPDLKNSALVELAKIYRLHIRENRIGNLQKLLQKFEDSLPLSKVNIEHKTELGKIYRSLGYMEQSVDAFKSIISLDTVRNDKFVHNQILNEIEISERKEVLQSKTRTMIAMILTRCNIKCRICGLWKTDWQVRDSFMQDIISIFPYLEEIFWQGGEVFMMKGFDDILQEGTMHPNLSQTIFTNGMMINEKILSKLEKGDVNIVLSIDGVTRDVYEYIRNGASFDKLIKVLHLLKEFRGSKANGMNIGLDAVISRTNYHQLSEFVDFAMEYGLDRMTFHPIRGVFGDENIFSPPDTAVLDHINAIMPGILHKASKNNFNLLNWLPTEYGRTEQEQKSYGTQSKDDAPDDMICYAPWQRLVLDCGGKVRPASHCLKLFVGDAQKDSLEEIWNGEKIRHYRRKLATHNYHDLVQPECISGQIREKLCDIY